MDTPITVSSTSTVPNKSDFLQLDYGPGDNAESIINLGSTSFERVPLTWKTKNNVYKRSSNTTLTKIEAVTNWIRSIEEPEHDPILMNLSDNIKESGFRQGTTAEVINEDFHRESKSVILFRCDFNKSVSPTTYYPNLTPLITHFKNERHEIEDCFSSSISSKSNNTNEKHGPSNTDKEHVLKHSANKIVNCYNKHNKIPLQKECSKMNDVNSNGSSEVYEVPLSPESRKKELCSYLQLMNPADKKERFILQNRRSTRVRNLHAMQEKKKEKDDKVTENRDNKLKEPEKCLTLKSFKELNIRVEKSKFSDEFLKNKLSEKEDIFSFPFPSKELTENIQDFDNTMSKLVTRYKRICRIKNLNLNCKIDFKTVSTKDNQLHKVKGKVECKNDIKNKDKVKIKNIQNREKTKQQRLKSLLKKRYINPMRAARTSSLRSTGKLKNISLKKLIGKKEKELLQRKNIRKSLGGRKENKQKLSMPRRKSCNETIDKAEITSSQCEIITLPKSHDNCVDLENLVDDMIDFNNLSEEHKKCLIESRILSTKQSPHLTNNNCTEKETSKSFYDLQGMSPLYGFNRADVNEVSKICEVYKSSMLNSGKGDIIDEVFGVHKIKEANAVTGARDHFVYKTETKRSHEELPPRDSNLKPHCIDVSNDKLDLICEQKDTDDDDDKSTCSKITKTNGITLQEHNYAGLPSDDEIEIEELDAVTDSSKNLLVRNCMEINPRNLIKTNQFEVLPYNKSIKMKSLHKSLQYVKRRMNNSISDQSFTREWDGDNSYKQRSKKQSHYISINKQNGVVLKAFYIDFNLIVCQENIVSFWMQTPLGNILGSQNMWIPRGQTQRLVLNGKCMQKDSMEMVIVMETNVAYIELWTKEHKSDIREGPVADVFATIYFWKQRQSGLDKKVLQLENINGFADDVQYSVMKSVPKIIVSWHSAHDDVAAKRTFIHAYELALDYQTVANIHNIEPVDHYVSSLHNIEDCDNLIMGSGENKITLWNVEYGYIIATIVLSEIKSPLSTLWVKCDRGFLFALQQCVDRELRLIAINGINHSWKKLASYIPPEGFDRLRGVCIENGLLISFYDQGILCWKAETGEPMDESSIESDIIPSGKYVIIIEDEQILVKHAMTHLMSLTVEET